MSPQPGIPTRIDWKSWDGIHEGLSWVSLTTSDRERSKERPNTNNLIDSDSLNGQFVDIVKNVNLKGGLQTQRTLL